jgi:predicted DsbA family dithiol-disulfide isomerase
MTQAPRLDLQIDIVSDVVCPWCVVGYKQLEKALAGMSDKVRPVIRWHPFELNPNMPPEGQNLREHILQKYGGSAGQSSGARDRLTALGESLGFRFDYHDQMRMVNTFRAHQLLHWAGEKGVQTGLKMALFAAFFSDRQNVNDEKVLVAAAESVGLDGSEAAAVLADERYAVIVREEQEYWRDQDVYAVPTFFFQRKFPIPGAQEPETFVRLLEKIVARHRDQVA